MVVFGVGFLRQAISHAECGGFRILSKNTYFYKGIKDFNGWLGT